MNPPKSLKDKLSENLDYCRQKIKNIPQVLAQCVQQRLITDDDYENLLTFSDRQNKQAEQLCLVMKRQSEEGIQKFIDILKHFGSPDVAERLSLTAAESSHSGGRSLTNPSNNVASSFSIDEILEKAVKSGLCEKTIMSEDLLSRLEVTGVITTDLKNKIMNKTSPYAQASELYQTLITSGDDVDYDVLKKALETTRNKAALRLMSLVEKSIPGSTHDVKGNTSNSNDDSSNNPSSNPKNPQDSPKKYPKWLLWIVLPITLGLLFGYIIIPSPSIPSATQSQSSPLTPSVISSLNEMIVVPEVTNVLIEDGRLVANWLEFRDALGLSSRDTQPWEIAYKASNMQVYELFSKLLSSWRSLQGRKATVARLCIILEQIGSQASSDKLKLGS